MRAGITLDGLIEVFPQGDERINTIISSLLTTLADANGAKKADNGKLKKLREENKSVKARLEEMTQDFKILVDATKMIAENYAPPKEERRSCMNDINDIIRRIEDGINHGGLPGIAALAGRL